MSAQLKTSARRHQLCLAHLLRELNYFEELYNHKWVIDMKALLKKAIILKNSMILEQYTEQLEKRTAILQEFEILINQTLPDKVSKIVSIPKEIKKAPASGVQLSVPS